MTLPNNIHNPQHWYERAAAMRLLADEIKTIETKTMMLQLAADYDKLADRAEERRRKKATTANCSNSEAISRHISARSR